MPLPHLEGGPLIECDHCLSSSTFAIFLILPAATTYQLITAHLTLSHNKTRKFYYIKTVNTRAKKRFC